MTTESRTRIMVVEDDAVLRQLLSEYFQATYAVETYGHAAPALERVLRDPPDVVILDINMPGVNGLKALEIIKGIQPALPVLVLTGTPEYAVAGDSMKAGAFAYIPKPCNLRYLDHLVTTALAGRGRATKTA